MAAETPSRTSKLPSAPDSGGASSSGGQPPRLQTKIWSGVKTLLIVNILPVLGLGYLAIKWFRGELALRKEVTSEQITIIALVLVGCVVLAISCWFVMPLARWMRDYPAWHFQHRSRIAWFLPTLGGLVVWFLLWLIGISAILTSLFVIVTGSWKIAAPFFGGGS